MVNGKLRAISARPMPMVISPLIKVFSGHYETWGRFNPEFTGCENVFINGEIMGIGRAGK